MPCDCLQLLAGALVKVAADMVRRYAWATRPKAPLFALLIALRAVVAHLCSSQGGVFGLLCKLFSAP